MIRRAHRRKYPTLGPPANAWQAGERGLDFDPRPATIPTAAEPGTPAKIAVMIERIRRGQTLWAPGDASHEHRMSDRIRLPALSARYNDQDQWRGVKLG